MFRRASLPLAAACASRTKFATGLQGACKKALLVACLLAWCLSLSLSLSLSLYLPDRHIHSSVRATSQYWLQMGFASDSSAALVMPVAEAQGVSGYTTKPSTSSFPSKDQEVDALLHPRSLPSQPLASTTLDAPRFTIVFSFSLIARLHSFLPPLAHSSRVRVPHPPYSELSCVVY